MRRLLIACCLIAVLGCGGSGAKGGAGGSGGGSGGTGACVTGSEGCPCYGNGTCNGSLVCLSQLCVSLTGAAGTMGSGGSAAGTGGSATGTGGTGGEGGATGGAGGGGGATGGTGGTTAPFPSCAGLAPTCGPTASSDCCASSPVPGGSFNRSNDSAAPATVSPFRLDTYAVTVGRFRQFVAAYYANGWRPTPGQGKNPHNSTDTGWDSAWNSNLPPDVVSQLTAQLNCGGSFPTWTASPGGNENRPITCASWYEAFAFCTWDGGRLPTEAEYNFASAGGSEQRFYPWSNPPGDTTIDSSYLSYNCMGDGSAAGNCSATDLMVVGSKPKGNARWGHADLAGNVLHWTRDWNGPYQTPCNDCAQLTTSDSWRLLRGGAYSYAASYQTTAFRFGLYFGYYRSADLGFRCARDP